jgi:glutathione S-transferase
MLTLFTYNVSPYAAKVRAVLRYKQLDFAEQIVHPLDRRELVRRSGQAMVPVIDDDGHIVVDSTRIVAFLDDRYPQRPVLPRDPALRARALFVEELIDEGLGSTVQPVRWLIPANARRTAAFFRSAYPPGLIDDLRIGLVAAALRIDMRRKHGSRTFGVASPATLLARLGELLDSVDAALAETGWLVGSSPSVADFALVGWLSRLYSLDGWDRVQAHQHVARAVQLLADPAQEATDVAHDATGPLLPRSGNGSPPSRPSPA